MFSFTKLTLILCFVFIGFGLVTPQFSFAQEKVFTLTELATFDGKDGRAAYFAFKGKVYDVSNSSLWKLGEHFGVQAGKDLTGLMAGAPHGEEVMSKVPMVGSLQVAGNSAQATEKPVANSTVQVVESPRPNVSDKPWYANPLRPFGMSILGWTGLLLGIVFVLNFFTCFALPWSKLPLPWKGNKPGPDALDAAPVHMNFASIHKYFAWATVVLGIIHGILGFLQVFFKLYL